MTHPDLVADMLFRSNLPKFCLIGARAAAHEKVRQGRANSGLFNDEKSTYTNQADTADRQTHRRTHELTDKQKVGRADRLIDSWADR